MDYFEKLIIAKKYIKQLEFALKEYVSEIAELKHINKKLTSYSNEDKINFKKENYINNMSIQIDQLKNLLRKLKNDNEKLICQLTKYNI